MVGRDIGEHIKALVPDFAEEFRAPALPIKDHGNPALACQAPNLGQDLAAQHRQQIVIRGSGDDKQRLGVLLVHPDIGGGRLAQATPSDPRFRQLVCGSVIGPDVAVEVEPPQGAVLRVSSEAMLTRPAEWHGGFCPSRRCWQ